MFFTKYFNLQKEVMPSSRLALLPKEYNTQSLLPQAHAYQLAFVKIPEDVSCLFSSSQSLSLKFLNVIFVT